MHPQKTFQVHHSLNHRTRARRTQCTYLCFGLCLLLWIHWDNHCPLTRTPYGKSLTPTPGWSLVISYFPLWPRTWLKDASWMHQRWTHPQGASKMAPEPHWAHTHRDQSQAGELPSQIGYTWFPGRRFVYASRAYCFCLESHYFFLQEQLFLLQASRSSLNETWQTGDLLPSLWKFSDSHYRVCPSLQLWLQQPFLSWAPWSLLRT